jgi:23S rRNA pseudouridine1911/1915/1917 synthase
MANKDYNQEQDDFEESGDELYEHHRFIVDKGQEPLRIDKYLTHKIRNASRSRIQAALQSGNIMVNDKPVKPNFKVKPLETIQVLMPEPPRDTEIYPENIPLDIVYEDKYLLVVNKPAGMVVHPGHNNYTGTLVHALAYHFQNLPSLQGEGRPGLVHRIDKDTSGLLVIGKDEFTLSALAKQFFEHTSEREYLALVWGNIEKEKGTVTGNLARSLKDRRIVQVYDDATIGKHAITHYEVVERFHYTTLVKCVLETGRTHQIRVHMQHIKHPLFADESYGGKEVLVGPQFTKYKQFIENCFKICNRQVLHAQTLGFEHPITKERMNFEAKLPEDIESLLEKWRNYSKGLTAMMEG